MEPSARRLCGLEGAAPYTHATTSACPVRMAPIAFSTDHVAVAPPDCIVHANLGERPRWRTSSNASRRRADVAVDLRARDPRVGDGELERAPAQLPRRHAEPAALLRDAEARHREPAREVDRRAHADPRATAERQTLTTFSSITASSIAVVSLGNGERINDMSADVTGIVLPVDGGYVRPPADSLMDNPG